MWYKFNETTEILCDFITTKQQYANEIFVKVLKSSIIIRIYVSYYVMKLLGTIFEFIN